MKKIAIDARYIGMSGIGRVLEGILDNISYDKYDVLLVGKVDLKNRYPKAKIIACDDNPYSKKGLLSFPKKVNECDCVFIPNFIIPFGIRIPVYTIIHDLIFLDMKNLTTNNAFDFLIKKNLLKRCVKRSKKIFVDSLFTLKRCNHYFPKYSDKLILNYPGLSKEIIEYANTHTNVVEKENSIVFVGNVKPHKGISILLDAFDELNNNDLTLKIIGKKEKFLVGIDFDESKYKNVVFTGRLSDEELLEEISKAKYLVQPSLYEGFGVPPLEAMYLGTIPVISNIEVFKEVYGELPVIFFNDKEELVDILSSGKIIELCPKEEIYNKYNFSKMTKILIDNIENN